MSFVQDLSHIAGVVFKSLSCSPLVPSSMRRWLPYRLALTLGLFTALCTSASAAKEVDVPEVTLQMSLDERDKIVIIPTSYKITWERIQPLYDQLIMAVQMGKNALTEANPLLRIFFSREVSHHERIRKALEEVPGLSLNGDVTILTYALLENRQVELNQWLPFSDVQPKTSDETDVLQYPPLPYSADVRSAKQLATIDHDAIRHPALRLVDSISVATCRAGNPSPHEAPESLKSILFKSPVLLSTDYASMRLAARQNRVEIMADLFDIVPVTIYSEDVVSAFSDAAIEAGLKSHIRTMDVALLYLRQYLTWPGFRAYRLSESLAFGNIYMYFYKRKYYSQALRILWHYMPRDASVEKAISFIASMDADAVTMHGMHILKGALIDRALEYVFNSAMLRLINDEQYGLIATWRCAAGMPQSKVDEIIELFRATANAKRMPAKARSIWEVRIAGLYANLEGLEVLPEHINWHKARCAWDEKFNELIKRVHKKLSSLPQPKKIHSNYFDSRNALVYRFLDENRAKSNSYTGPLPSDGTLAPRVRVSFACTTSVSSSMFEPIVGCEIAYKEPLSPRRGHDPDMFLQIPECNALSHQGNADGGKTTVTLTSGPDSGDDTPRADREGEPYGKMVVTIVQPEETSKQRLCDIVGDLGWKDSASEDNSASDTHVRLQNLELPPQFRHVDAGPDGEEETLQAHKGPAVSHISYPLPPVSPGFFYPPPPPGAQPDLVTPCSAPLEPIPDDGIGHDLGPAEATCKRHGRVCACRDPRAAAREYLMYDGRSRLLAHITLYADAQRKEMVRVCFHGGAPTRRAYWDAIAQYSARPHRQDCRCPYCETYVRLDVGGFFDGKKPAEADGPWEVVLPRVPLTDREWTPERTFMGFVLAAISTPKPRK